MTTRVCIAGATGWAGSALARAVLLCEDLILVSAVSRKQAGRTLGDVLHGSQSRVAIAATVREALCEPCDVLVEYTGAGAAMENIRCAIDRGVHVVIGSSGITEEQFTEIDRMAVAREVGVLAVGNFSIVNFLLQKCAQKVAAHVRTWEVIDYASEAKIDAPSGTARELANRLSAFKQLPPAVPIGRTLGEPAARGADLQGTRVHSVRLPGHVIGLEVHFGLGDERLVMRYEAGGSAETYVDGALLAIRRVREWVGVRRGLEAIREG